MEIGCHLPTGVSTVTPQHIAAVVARLEEYGFSSLWTSDVPVSPSSIDTPHPRGGRQRPTAGVHSLEPMTTLSFVAAVTTKMRLGLSAFVLPLRHPLSVAKMITTVDRLSNGRLLLCLGIGWMREQFDVMGLPFSERGHIADECLMVLNKCFSSEEFDHVGKYFRFPKVVFGPRPFQKPFPLFIAGDSRFAIRRAIRFGAGWHTATNSLTELKSRLVALSDECERHSRSRDTVELSMRVTFSFGDSGNAGLLHGSVAKQLDDLFVLNDLGIKHLLIEPAYAEPETRQRAYEAFGQVLLRRFLPFSY